MVYSIRYIICFNPYWVFQCAATNVVLLVLSHLPFVSIPIGFSNALRPLYTVGLDTPEIGFNPYWVFQCAATQWQCPGNVRPAASFQSLLGFPMRCDLCGCDRVKDSTKMFQSLLGFPMRCDALPGRSCSARHVVSIPIGFSNALRPYPVEYLRLENFVSIPIGFSNALRPPSWSGITHSTRTFQSLLGFPMRCDGSPLSSTKYRIGEFQSLLGFPMRCDDEGTEYLGLYRPVSIPIGFSNALRHSEYPTGRCPISVSIPIGFSNALRLVSQMISRNTLPSFNPYWVFQCAATYAV